MHDEDRMSPASLTGQENKELALLVIEVAHGVVHVKCSQRFFLVFQRDKQY
jgi:hypothetical protein